MLIFMFYTVAAQSHGLGVMAGVFPTSNDTDVTSNSTKVQQRKNGSRGSSSSSSSGSSGSVGEGVNQRRNSQSSCPPMLTDSSSTDIILAATSSTGAELNLILFDEVSRVRVIDVLIFFLYFITISSCSYCSF
jgi:hypothetical protein